jgi:uncharacterized protein YjiK
MAMRSIKRVLFHRFARRSRGLLLLLLLLMTAYQIHAWHMGERLSRWLTGMRVAESVPGGLLSQHYQAQIDAKVVPGVGDNLSGISYDGDRDQLWAVQNNPPVLLAMDKDGEVRARYPLEGFSDVEDLSYLGNDQLLLVEERKRALVVVPVPVSAGPLLRTDYKALSLELGPMGNQGFEGVSYDRSADRLFVVKEHSPIKIYEVRGFGHSLKGAFDLDVIDHADWVREAVLASDLSAAHYDERSGHLLLLSEESKRIMELDGQSGTLLASLELKGGTLGLKGSVAHAEGMTFDPLGQLFIVSEPNVFYRFRRE